MEKTHSQTQSENQKPDESSAKANYEFRKKSKEAERKKEGKKAKLNYKAKKIARYSAFSGVGIAVIAGIVWLAVNQPNLPPTTVQGHIESSPPSHILTTPIPDNIQRHMLEHADGAGQPGIIIQYNCDKFKCAPDLIQKLTELVKDYPANVYLAPNTYDAKIALTKEGKIKTLEKFDEEAIKKFIEKR